MDFLSLVFAHIPYKHASRKTKVTRISSITESTNETIETTKHRQITQEILIAIYAMKRNAAIRTLNRKSKRDYFNNLINKSQ